MKRTVAVGLVLGLLVSGLFGGGVGMRLFDIDSLWYFVVSPGLLAVAATSDMVKKPPPYETWLTLLAVNLVWYLVLAVALSLLTRLLRAAIGLCGGFSLSRSREKKGEAVEG